VPWRLIGETVRVVIAGGFLRASHAGREVAVHPRRTGRFERVIAAAAATRAGRSGREHR
jgi:hypothetical protein